jgi:glycerol-3-phosphate O-acyltransferase / dihydroxyacetone phosphate acyltransferase
MLTEKVVFCLVVVPILWAFYGVVLLCMTDLDRPTVALIMMTIPLFAYIGIVVTEAGMVDMKDLRPYFMRLFPSARKRLAVLPETRMALQTDLRAFIKSIGTLRPELLNSLMNDLFGVSVAWFFSVANESLGFL